MLLDGQMAPPVQDVGQSHDNYACSNLLFFQLLLGVREHNLLI